MQNCADVHFVSRDLDASAKELADMLCYSFRVRNIVPNTTYLLREHAPRSSPFQVGSHLNSLYGGKSKTSEFERGKLDILNRYNVVQTTVNEITGSSCYLTDTGALFYSRKVKPQLVRTSGIYTREDEQVLYNLKIKQISVCYSLIMALTTTGLYKITVTINRALKTTLIQLPEGYAHERIAKVACGTLDRQVLRSPKHFVYMILFDDGALFSEGQYPTGEKNPMTLVDNDVKNVFCTSHNTYYTKHNKLFSYGVNISGSCGIGSVDAVDTPQVVPNISDAREIDAIAAHNRVATLLLTMSGKLYSSGACHDVNSNEFVLLPAFEELEIKKMVCNNEKVFVLTEDNRIYQTSDGVTAVEIERYKGKAIASIGKLGVADLAVMVRE